MKSIKTKDVFGGKSLKDIYEEQQKERLKLTLSYDKEKLGLNVSYDLDFLDFTEECNNPLYNQ